MNFEKSESATGGTPTGWESLANVENPFFNPFTGVQEAPAAGGEWLMMAERMRNNVYDVYRDVDTASGRRFHGLAEDFVKLVGPGAQRIGEGIYEYGDREKQVGEPVTDKMMELIDFMYPIAGENAANDALTDEESARKLAQLKEEYFGLVNGQVNTAVNGLTEIGRGLQGSQNAVLMSAGNALTDARGDNFVNVVAEAEPAVAQKMVEYLENPNDNTRRAWQQAVYEADNMRNQAFGRLTEPMYNIRGREADNLLDSTVALKKSLSAGAEDKFNAVLKYIDYRMEGGDGGAVAPEATLRNPFEMGSASNAVATGGASQGPALMTNFLR